MKEVQEMEENLPEGNVLIFPDPNILSEFSLIISPLEGFWKEGKFKFQISVPEEYNMQVSYKYLLLLLSIIEIVRNLQSRHFYNLRYDCRFLIKFLIT